MFLQERALSAVIGISTALPSFRYEQSALTDFMVDRTAITGTPRERLLRALYRHSGISYRYSVLEDFNGINPQLFTHPEKEPSTEARMAMFDQHAPLLATEASSGVIKNTVDRDGEPVNPEKITHLITVSCTGLSAPGLEIRLLKDLGLRSTTGRFGVNFMGCYAAFPALRIADAICRSEPSACVLIVSVELCTLHFQNRTDTDTLLANALFSDGAAAMLVTSTTMAESRYTKFLQVSSFFSDCYSTASREMAWEVGSSGFNMRLSQYVPEILSGEFEPAVRKIELAKPARKVDYWAVHPGGKRILDLCRSKLQLNGSLDPSYKVLNDYGNMSSATVLFVMKDLWDHHLNSKAGGTMLAAGFGPGLTLETAILEVNQ